KFGARRAVVRSPPPNAPVAALLNTAVVPLVTVTIRVPAGIPVPVTSCFTSLATNAIVGDATVVVPFVTASWTVRPDAHIASPNSRLVRRPLTVRLHNVLGTAAPSLSPGSNQPSPPVGRPQHYWL